MHSTISYQSFTNAEMTLSLYTTNKVAMNEENLTVKPNKTRNHRQYVSNITSNSWLHIRYHRNYLCRRLASGEGIVLLGVRHAVCVCVSTALVSAATVLSSYHVLLFEQKQIHITTATLWRSTVKCLTLNFSSDI